MSRHDLLTYQNVTQAVTEWALDYGITTDTILRRLRSGMSVERAITKPVAARAGAQLPDEKPHQPMTVSFSGRALTYAEWSMETGLPATTIRSRIKDGWPVDLALNTPHRSTND